MSNNTWILWKKKQKGSSFSWRCYRYPISYPYQITCLLQRGYTGIFDYDVTNLKLGCNNYVLVKPSHLCGEKYVTCMNFTFKVLVMLYVNYCLPLTLCDCFVLFLIYSYHFSDGLFIDANFYATKAADVWFLACLLVIVSVIHIAYSVWTFTVLLSSAPIVWLFFNRSVLIYRHALLETIAILRIARRF